MRRVWMLCVLITVLPAANFHAQDKNKLAAKFGYVQVKSFAVQDGVEFSAEYQRFVVEDLVKQLQSVRSLTQVLQPDEMAPEGVRLLRVEGTITKFSKGSQVKRYLVGFGAGKTVVVANVRFIDGSTDQVLLEQKVDGKVVMGVLGGKSDGATNGLAKEIVKVGKKSFF